MNTCNVIGSFVNGFGGIYLLFKIFNEKLNFKNYKTYLYSLIFVIFSILIFIYVSNYLRLIVNFLFLLILSIILFKRKVSKLIIGTLFVQFTMCISELIILVLILPIYATNSLIFLKLRGNFILNIIITLISIILINDKRYINLLKSIENFIYNINSKSIYLILLFFVISLNLILAVTYFSQNFVIIFFVNIFFINIYTIILYMVLMEKNSNIKFKIENEALMKNLNEYEKMLDYQRVANHENKNQLLIIKIMIGKSDKKLIEYINEIIKDKREDNEELYSKVKKLPTGGLQGIIYQKMLIMEENEIRVFLSIDKRIKNIDFSLIDIKTNYDLCRIIGIFLDNAIDESKKVEKKEININIYFDKYFIIEISNYFEGNLDVEKIYNKGYSTKGKGHGYGLTLVKNIIEQNKNIINENKIEKNIFTQIIKIKM